jgi:hypothetical protein
MSTAVERLLRERGPMSRAEAFRVLVREFDAEGCDVGEIGRRIGITSDRVEQILDQLDGVPHTDEQAPALEPIHGAPKVVRSQAVPVPPGFEVHERIRRGRRTPSDEIKCGTLPGYRRHTRKREKPCEPCREVYNEHERDRKAALKAALRAAQSGSAGAVKPARQRVQVRWLIPRGERMPEGLRREFGVANTAGRIVAVSDTTAELAAADGSRVYVRTVTDWLGASQ